MIAAVVPGDGQLHFIEATGPQKAIASRADTIRKIHSLGEVGEIVSLPEPAGWHHVSTLLTRKAAIRICALTNRRL